MITASTGTPFEARVQSFPPGLVGTVGVRVLDSGGNSVVPRETFGIVENPAGSGSYVATLRIDLPGAYTVFWDWDGGGPLIPSHTAEEDLAVSGQRPIVTTVAETFPPAATAAAVPHFALPFRILAGAPAVNEQDSREDIHDCVEAVVRTPVGSRIELPAFGAPDVTFSLGTPLDTAALAAAVEQWEPRAAAAASAEDTTVPDYVAGITVEIQGGTS